MAQPIEDYALIGDLCTAALVSRSGSIDWFCPPRFDSPACFAALLGDAEHGHWRLSPSAEPTEVNRHYQADTLVLCTEMRCVQGRIRITDCMPFDDNVTILRHVECLEGCVEMDMSLLPRFDYGREPARFEQSENGVCIKGGEHPLWLFTDLSCEWQDADCINARFSLSPGEQRLMQLTHLSGDSQPESARCSEGAIEDCAGWWRDWVRQCSYQGRWRDAVVRSLITLKALTYAPSGGMVAAPTSSLPEKIGGAANWDYRFCWLRDAVLAVDVFLDSNFFSAAHEWHSWLLRAIGQDNGTVDVDVLYSITGTEPMPERELGWLPGWKGSQPVRVGNAASEQHQLDVYGLLMDVLHIGRRSGMETTEQTWDYQCKIMDFLVEHWREPDDGIWELRGAPRHYTHSKVYAWVAFDRSIRDAEEFGLKAPVDLWRSTRDEIHADVCRNGIDPSRNAFQQTYDEARPDASLLMVPLLGFLPADDDRVQATLAWIEDTLCEDGLVYRFLEDDAYDGSEGAFLTCSFWLADVLTMSGRVDDAQAVFEKILGLRNDVGLLAEEYDPQHGLLGNFPQALSHLALVKSAYLIDSDKDAHRGGQPERHAYRPVP
ncbi:glycoside hydrolase family 15 protein [Pseudomonas sp. gcc21]|uniref:glycoside hydrolase family 15 protein n=1 Tax=Pseudomonas sp. gcc21 TaxID=2726989 RepID=UPI001451BEF6|nr:glycoside hydrolase family 15 protein [Pseudomonas sp. gcc21]QJD60354.1 glycoside hydrolase family 15 protein [Pseudomonas sp. gcc21]